MSQETVTGITTPGDGPVQGETPTREFDPKELGIETDPIETPAANPDETPNPNPEPEDAIGLALKRGRPARDLEGLDEDEQKLFKNMSREAYERLFPFYKKFKGKDKDLDELPTLREKLKSLETATKPQPFYDHEEAYLLQQDYRDALVKARELRDLQNHWQEQLIAAEEGKPVRDVIAGQNGEWQLSDPIESNPRVKAQILATLNQVTQAQQTHQATLENLKLQSKQQFTSYRDGLSKVYDTVFAKHKDTLEPLAAKELEQFPPFARDRIETKLMANALALIKYIVAADKKQQTQTTANNANLAAARSSGPTMRSITTSPKPAPDKTATAEDYKKFRMEFGV